MNLTYRYFIQKFSHVYEFLFHKSVHEVHVLFLSTKPEEKWKANFEPKDSV